MKKGFIFLCILMLLLGCTACKASPQNKEENPSSQAAADVSSNASGLGQEIIVDGDIWDNSTVSGELGDNTVILGDGEQNTTSTAGTVDTTTSGGGATSSSGGATSSAQGSTSSKTSQNVINVNSNNVSRDDKGWSEWK